MYYNQSGAKEAVWLAKVKRRLDYCLTEAVVGSDRLNNAYWEGLYFEGEGK